MVNKTDLTAVGCCKILQRQIDLMEQYLERRWFPLEGALFEIRSQARRKYHLANKYIYKNKNFMIKERVSEISKV